MHLMLCSNWRRQGNMSIKLAVAESIGLLSEVMSTKKFIAKFVDIVSYFCMALNTAQSSPQHQTPLTRGICNAMHNASKTGKNSGSKAKQLILSRESLVIIMMQRRKGRCVDCLISSTR
eukprot:175834_1